MPQYSRSFNAGFNRVDEMELDRIEALDEADSDDDEFESDPDDSEFDDDDDDSGSDDDDEIATDEDEDEIDPADLADCIAVGCDECNDPECDCDCHDDEENGED